MLTNIVSSMGHAVIIVFHEKFCDGSIVKSNEEATSFWIVIQAHAFRWKTIRI
jgi:hypothetical protein